MTIKWGDLRAATVTLIITDSITRDVDRVTRTITAPGAAPTNTETK